MHIFGDHFNTGAHSLAQGRTIMLDRKYNSIEWPKQHKNIDFDVYCNGERVSRGDVESVADLTDEARAGPKLV